MVCSSVSSMASAQPRGDLDLDLHARVDQADDHRGGVQRLKEAGLGDYIARIHSPIGLDLGGRAPAEIAVSILAEIIRVRYQGAAA